MDTNTQTTATLTRRQAREIERRTGVRPVATAEQVELANTVATAIQHDTAFIERNSVTELVSVVPTEIMQRSAVAVDVPAAFAGRSLTVRAAMPASLVAKQRRRAAAGFAAAASAAAVASTGLLVPVAQGAAPAAHSADLASAVDKASADATQVDATPSADRVVTNVVEAPAAVVNRTDTAAFDAADVEVEPTASTSTGTSTESSVQTSTAAASSESSDEGYSSGSGSTATASAGSSYSPTQYVAGDSIVATAYQFIGIPYTGGNTPEAGFDCSGLVQYVYGLHGISLGRSVGAQAAAGTVVSDPQPGDLVVMLGGGHIAIYTGNGMIIDAPDHGRTVQERAIWSDSAVDYYVRIGG